jgi:hypothetical protein
MGLFKADFFRSLVAGFVVGAGIVFATLDLDVGATLVDGVAPVAQAASAN